MIGGKGALRIGGCRPAKCCPDHPPPGCALGVRTHHSQGSVCRSLVFLGGGECSKVGESPRTEKGPELPPSHPMAPSPLLGSRGGIQAEVPPGPAQPPAAVSACTRRRAGAAATWLLGFSWLREQGALLHQKAGEAGPGEGEQGLCGRLPGGDVQASPATLPVLNELCGNDRPALAIIPPRGPRTCEEGPALLKEERCPVASRPGSSPGCTCPHASRGVSLKPGRA